ncbi:aldo/keto reductase [Microbacterium jejuense]|uniref:Aldo/keto reductase n=1 Tax=Microbacterium jejuense TaxID=1263637 RepID=A0ABS7HHN3_9MICO|nr:aldo/keto reductase [Microbacterium jejuense]MBW9092233.1 aldo/keto reductase [Microbacterium jejuense]
MTLNVSPLTLGASGLGRDTEPGSDGEAAAVDIAVRLLASTHAFVDTSNNYAGGRSEAVLGLAIARIGADATTRVISKVDAEPATGVFDRDRVMRSFDETTARLGVDRLPLLHLHDPYSVSFSEAMGPRGAVEGLIELRESGRVDAIGVAAGPVPFMARYVETGVFDAVLIHNRFTVVDRSAEPVFADARERGMTVFNAAPFGAGILATGPREGAMYGYRPATPELQEWVSKLERVCAAHGVTLPAVALHFSLRSPLVDSTVVGVSSAARLEQLDALAASPIPDGVWAELDELGPAPSPVDDSEYA